MEEVQISQVFGDLTVIEPVEHTGKNGRTWIRWKCQCSCGNERLLTSGELLSGHIKSCGHRKTRGYQRSSKTMVGQIFGKLTVIEPATEKGPRYWKCRCECGNEKVVLDSNLKRGLTRSCGCLHKSMVTKALLKDLSGMKFGDLTVLSRGTDYVSPTGYRSTRWRCKCACGQEKEIRADVLKSGTATSCGCKKSLDTSERLSLDIAGQRFGLLVVLGRAGTYTGSDGSQYSQWLCKCDCGTQKIVRGHDLVRGNVSSCGCLVSRGELQIRQILNDWGIQFNSQVWFKDLLSEKGWPLRFDFELLKADTSRLCLLEYQGMQHFAEQPQEFGKQQREITDKQKKEYCVKHNIPLYEIAYNEDIRCALEKIIKDYNITKVNPVPSLVPKDKEGVTTIPQGSTRRCNSAEGSATPLS